MKKFILRSLVGLQLIQLGISISNSKKLKKIMSKQDQINASLQQLDEATNEIASDLEGLRNQVKEGTVSDESLATLDRSVQRLRALGADEANPIPTTDSTSTTGNTSGETAAWEGDANA